MSYASMIVQNALLAELERLKTVVPMTPSVARNIEYIEGQKPPRMMTEAELRAYVDLWHRSIPK